MNKHGTTTTLLVTGFEPFGGSTLNPSQVVVDALVGGAMDLPGIEWHAALLPVDTSSIAAKIDALWARHTPDVVLHLGESGKADRLTLERVALNLLDFDFPDNTGKHVVDQPVDPDGPEARFATLPVRSLKDKLEAHGIASVMSLTAGAYLCNQTLYLSLAHAQRRGGGQVGFVHVPSLPEQVERGERKEPAMPREQLLEQMQCLFLLAVEGASTDKSKDRY